MQKDTLREFEMKKEGCKNEVRLFKSRRRLIRIR
jgi:hypothetical protein